MADESCQVAQDPGAALHELVALTHQESPVGSDEVRIGVEPRHVIGSRAGGELDLQRPQLRIDLNQEVDLALIAGTAAWYASKLRPVHCSAASS